MVVGLNAFYTFVATNASATGTTTPAFTPTVAELIVVKMICEQSAVIGTAPTATGLTFTARSTSAVASNVWAGIWTAPAAAGTAYTVNYGASSGSAGSRSAVAERWTGVTLAATPATANTQGSGAPTTTLTTTAANSAVSWLNGDWSAIGGARTYNTTSAVPVEQLSDQASAGTRYVADHAYQLAPVTGAQTLGLTAPVGQKWTLLGIELPATAGIAAHPRHSSRWR